MRIGFVRISNALETTTDWFHSFYEAKALRDQGAEVHLFDLPTEARHPSWLARRVLSRAITGKRILPDREPSVVNDYARHLSAQLEKKPVDVIFSHGTIPIGLLDRPVPIAFWADSVFAGMIDFYSGFSHLSQRSLRNGNRMEQAALARSALAIYSSDWAARSCLENYQVDNQKIQVIPYGPNLENEPPLEEIRAAIRARSPQICRLVFSGTDWERKGGDRAVGLVEELNRRGQPAELTILGYRPPRRTRLPKFVKVKGYVDTFRSPGREAYAAILASAHFLVLPSRADCSPRVLMEANAFGLPCLTTAVGGIPSIIRPGVNGLLFPPTAEFVGLAAAAVQEILQPDLAYQSLAMQTLDYHRGNHTWESSARRIMTLLGELCRR